VEVRGEVAAEVRGEVAACVEVRGEVAACLEARGEAADSVGDVEPLLLKRPRSAMDGTDECTGEVACSFRFLWQAARGDSR